MTAVIRGDAHMYFAPINLSKEMAEGGKVHRDRLATAKRLPEMPDMPTMTEAGLPFVYDFWFGLLTQAAVPRPIVQKINKDVTTAQEPGGRGQAKGAVRRCRSPIRRRSSTRSSDRNRASGRGVQGGQVGN